MELELPGYASGSGEKIAFAVGLLCTHHYDVWDEIDQQASVQLDVGVNRAFARSSSLSPLAFTNGLIVAH